MQRGLNGESSTLRSTNINGEKVIVSYALNDLAGWLIVVETPVNVAMAPAYRLLHASIAMFAISALIIGLLGLSGSKRFTKPLIDLSSIIKTISSGDLKDFEVNINSKNEIGEVYHNLKTMNSNLREFMSNIQTAATRLASHSIELASTAEETTQSLTQVVMTINEMAQGNSEQAVMVQDTTNAISKVDSIIAKASLKTEVAAEKAHESLELAKVGQKAIEHQSQKIQENYKYTNAVDESIQHLASMADEIHNIIGVINNIAEQTNLLALNASIEAARAGDAGRGFAVVAEEIRKLAEQTSNFTKKIENIVKNINGRVSETVNSMNQVKESVLVMGSSADDTKASFTRIFASITDLAQLTNDLNKALEEISSETKEVTNQAMSISAVVQEAAASMEEMSASSEEQLASTETIAQSSVELENMAQELLNEVSKFKISE